jgi:hypothetical protein
MTVRNADTGDASSLDLLAALLEEQDMAKAALGRKGYGCIGRPWLGVVDEIPSA